jgi:hypothetical protein
MTVVDKSCQYMINIRKDQRKRKRHRVDDRNPNLGPRNDAAADRVATGSGARRGVLRQRCTAQRSDTKSGRGAVSKIVQSDTKQDLPEQPAGDALLGGAHHAPLYCEYCCTIDIPSTFQSELLHDRSRCQTVTLFVEDVAVAMNSKNFLNFLGNRKMSQSHSKCD